MPKRRPGLNNAIDSIKPNSIKLLLGKRRLVILKEIGVGLARVIPNLC